jgi:type IV pilus assembly protein PilE
MKWILKNRKNCLHCLGFSLLELMLVVGIIAILAAIAIPSYNGYILKSRRSEAMINLVKFQGAYEEYNAQNNTYPASNTLPPSVVPPIPATTYYSYTSATTGTTYTITATAIAGSTQVNDTAGGVACSTMTINNIGAQTPAVCWVQ